jgi:hypothetical protein
MYTFVARTHAHTRARAHTHGITGRWDNILQGVHFPAEFCCYYVECERGV